MRFEDLTPAHVRHAIEIFLEHAWPAEPDHPQGGPREAAGPGASVASGAQRAAGARSTVEPLAAANTLEELFARFERSRDDDIEGARSYLLRLGNRRYPFMKFVVQEYLVDNEFFFSVDTHDNLDVRPNAPDFAAWQELKQFNRALKDQIEAAWRREALPTFADLRVLCEGLAPVERESDKRIRIALVDDEESVAIGLGALLRGRGYEVELFHSGESVLERLAKPPRPDLLILDYELPALDGEAVLAEIRATPELADLPVLMATASSIQLERLGPINGFLHKPYPRRLLFTTIARLTERSARPNQRP
ncbi:MAG: response regulator [Planctomycetes bacterium]|nr:response regulator [Planctomycetota bacterium]